VQSLRDWRRLAHCREDDTEVFFPAAEDNPAPRRKIGMYDQALEICEGCPVRNACLEAALAVPQADDGYGVFGGTTPEARRNMRKMAVSA
jgi:WhiB family redox-sensing transcriptional regulator